MGAGGWGDMEKKAFDGGAGEQSRSPGRLDAGIRGKQGQQTGRPSCGLLGLDHCFVTCSGTQSTDRPSPHQLHYFQGCLEQTFPRPPNCQGPLRRQRTLGCVPTRGQAGTSVPRKSLAPPQEARIGGESAICSFRKRDSCPVPSLRGAPRCHTARPQAPVFQPGPRSHAQTSRPRP